MPLLSTPPPQKIGRYRVIRPLGTGAMGEVFEAEDAQLGRRIALKVLSPEMAALSEYRERFRREAVAMAQVRHPNVVQVYEMGLEGELPFFTMELVDGGDCANSIERLERVGVSELAKIGIEAAQGLGAAAKKGIVHRDVKPANLLIHQGEVKVVDFGIARELQATTGLTRYGTVLGTPEYMSPEQAMGLPVDLRSDLYSLGISLYHIATLRLPFTGEASAVLQAQVDRPLPDPRTYRADLSEDFCEVLARMLDKDPRGRHQSYEELGADLAPLRAASPAEAAEAARPGSLLFADRSRAGRTILLPLGEFVVGREVGCQLVLDDVQVSRRHAAFIRTLSGLSVSDLGSRNAMLVNGKRVTQAELRVGDQVQIGSTTLKVLMAPVSRGVSAVRPATTSSSAAEARGAFLVRLARGLTGPTPAESLLKVLPDLLDARPPMMPVGRLILLRGAPGQPGQVVVHEARTVDDAVPPLTSLLQEVCLRGQGVTIPDARAESRFSAESPKVAFVVCCPLVHNGKSLGAVYADSMAAHQVTPAEASFFEAVGHLLSVALHT